MESQLIDINWYYEVVEIGTFLDLFILLTMVKYPKMTCFISAIAATTTVFTELSPTHCPAQL